MINYYRPSITLQLVILICVSINCYEDMRSIKISTPCPFAKKSISWENVSHWDNNLDISSNIQAFIQKDFDPFISTCTNTPGNYDNIGLIIRDKKCYCDITQLTQTFHKILSLINDSSVKELKNYEYNYSNNVIHKWQFTYKDIRLFIITYAPFYEIRHPRFTPTDSAVIIFQLESSFKKYLSISPEIRHKQKIMIQSRFEQLGQPYQRVTITDKWRHEAYRYILAANESCEPIIWWNINKKNKFLNIDIRTSTLINGYYYFRTFLYYLIEVFIQR